MLEALARLAAEILHLAADKVEAHRDGLKRVRASFDESRNKIDPPPQ